MFYRFSYLRHFITHVSYALLHYPCSSWLPFLLTITCRQTWCMSCCGHQRSKLPLIFSVFPKICGPLVFQIWTYKLTHAVHHLLLFLFGLVILILPKSLSLNSAENAELYEKVCSVLWKKRYSVLQMSLIFYLDKSSYNHSIDFSWLPYNLGPVVCTTFC